MARIAAPATPLAGVFTTSEVVFRRDAHWAPFETADMTLLPTWTPSGDGERRRSGRDGARTRGYPGSGGGMGAGDRSSVSAAIDRRWGTPCTGHSGTHHKGMPPSDACSASAAHTSVLLSTGIVLLEDGLETRATLRGDASRGSSGAPRRPAD